MPTHALPSFFNPEHAGQLFVERSSQVWAAAQAQGPKPSAFAQASAGLLVIDAQVSFCHPQGSLFVPRAVEDNDRALAWFYGNLTHLKGLHFSLDTHHQMQIFHPSWWIDAQGRHPEAFTVISLEEAQAGRWRAVREQAASLQYLERLEQGGRYQLTIWPFHCLLGTTGSALMPAWAEAALYHGACSGVAPDMVQKGQAQLTENYSVLSPEVRALQGRALGGFNEALFDRLLSYQKLYVLGQASSHCVLSTLNDLADRIESIDSSLLKKVHILTDAMSPVPPPPLAPLPEALNFPRLAEEGLKALEKRGMVLTDTSWDLNHG